MNYITNKIVNTQININLKVPPDSYSQMILRTIVNENPQGKVDAIMNVSNNIRTPSAKNSKDYTT